MGEVNHPEEEREVKNAECKMVDPGAETAAEAKQEDDDIIIASAKITKVIADIYRLLNYSAISGEYIREASFSVSLNEIICQIDAIFDEINTDNLNNPIHKIIWGCLINLKESIRHYLFEFRRYETWLKNPYLRIINDDVLLALIVLEVSQM